MTTVLTSGPLIGPILRSLRADAGLTQTQLAELTGIAASQISKYETSIVTPDLDTTARLLTGLGHRLCVMSRADAATARQRQAVIDAALRLINPATDWPDELPALADAAAMLHAADPLDDSGSIYHDNAQLRRDLTAAHAEINRLRTLITRTADTLTEATR